MPGTAPPAAGSRFEGLDRLRGLALGAMLVHHLLSWTGGDEQVRRLLAVADGMNATDLAAPAFALAAGASVSLSTRRVAGRPGALRGALRRWAGIFAWGVAVSFALDGAIDGLGVLEILALVGAALAVAVATGDGRPHPLRWALAATALAAAALPSIEAATGRGGITENLLAGRFPLVSYLALGAAGAAVADTLGGREQRVRLLALAAGGAAAAAALQAAGATVWPPDRTPGGLPLIVPGIVASVAAWWGLSLLRGRVGDVLAHAGRRTLEVFVAHYGIRVVLNAGGWTGALEGLGWAAAAVATAVAGVLAAAWWDRRSAAAEKVTERGMAATEVGKRTASTGLVPSPR